jgi:hypothetical protein
VGRSVDLVVVRDVSVLRGVTCWRSRAGPALCLDWSDPLSPVPDLSVDDRVVPPRALFLRSLMRCPSELPREPSATRVPVVLLSVNDSVVRGDVDGTDFTASPALVESVAEFWGRVPNVVEKRSNREVEEDRSVTDGF